MHCSFEDSIFWQYRFDPLLLGIVRNTHKNIPSTCPNHTRTTQRAIACAHQKCLILDTTEISEQIAI